MYKSIDGVVPPRKSENPIALRFTLREKQALALAAKAESANRHEFIYKSTIIREALNQYEPFKQALKAVKEAHGTSQASETN